MLENGNSNKTKTLSTPVLHVLKHSVCIVTSASFLWEQKHLIYLFNYYLIHCLLVTKYKDF